MKTEKKSFSSTNYLRRTMFLEMAKTITRQQQKIKACVDYVISGLIYGNVN